MMRNVVSAESDLSASLDNNPRTNYGAVKVTSRETLGTVGQHSDNTPLILSGSRTTGNNVAKYEEEQDIQTI